MSVQHTCQYTYAVGHDVPSSSSPHAREALVTVCECRLAKQRPRRGQDPRGVWRASLVRVDQPSSAIGVARIRSVRV